MTYKIRHVEFMTRNVKWEIEGNRGSILITPINLDGPVTDPQFELSSDDGASLRKALSYVLGETDETPSV